MKKSMKPPINKQLKMLCKTLETRPEEVLQGFADRFDEIERMFDEINFIRHSFYTYGNEMEKEYIKLLDKQYTTLQKQWHVLKAKKIKKL